MTREQITSAVQAWADAGELDRATLVFAAEAVEIVPTPKPAPEPAPDLVELRRDGFRTSDKRLQLGYTHPGGTTRLWKDGQRTDTRDGDGNIYVTHSAQATYQVKEDTEPPEQAKSVTTELAVKADGTVGTVTPTDPQTQPPPIVVTDPAIPPDAIKVASLSDLQKTMQAGKRYLLEGRHTFGASAGLLLSKAGVQVYGTGTIIEFTSTLEYPRCFEVNADDILIAGFDLRGPAKTIGVQVNDGKKGCVVTRCTSPKGGLGTAIEAKGAINLTFGDSDFPGLRRYGMYGKIDGGFFVRLKIGPSLGGTYKGSSFNSEHGLRFEKYRNVTVDACELLESKKSGLNAKRGDKLNVTDCRIPMIGLGPLGDGDGLVHKEDPAYVATGIVLQRVTCENQMTLEMNCLGLLAQDSVFRKANIVDDDRYKPWRKIADPTFDDCDVSEWSGNNSRVVMK